MTLERELSIQGGERNREGLTLERELSIRGGEREIERV